MGDSAFRWCVRGLTVFLAAALALTATAGSASAGWSWEIQSTPLPRLAAFSAVSCPTDSFCVAVGSTPSANGGMAELLTAHWDGSAWIIDSTAKPQGSTFSQLFGVSCSSAFACTAVGHAGFRQSSDGLVARWNGSRWAAHSVGSPPGSRDSRLQAVSCASATACVAVGTYNTETRGSVLQAQHWNGERWRLESPPIPGPRGAYLAAVSCPSSTSCTAVGTYEDSSQNTVSLAERWNGTRWTVQPTPNPPGTLFSMLLGVSCASPIVCTAVGAYYDERVVQSTLVERWENGRWRVQASPSPGGNEDSYLLAVSCASPTTCTAVGTYDDDYPNGSTLALRWYGSKWIRSATPDPDGATTSSLVSVSCSSPATCTAVGYSARALVERFSRH